MNIEPMTLSYKKLPFLTEAQLAAHHDTLYAGYVKKLNEINDKLANLDHGVGNATHTDYRELKIESSFAENGVKLHEWYFENMNGDGQLSADMLKKLEESFNSFEDFQEELLEAGLSARGWVVMSQNESGQLNLNLCDAHNQNGIWGANPVLVLDVYEHASFLDYGTNRKEYIEKFIQNIDWKIVESRLK
jgi:superoxide dismutase, Fe-Mn family